MKKYLSVFTALVLATISSCSKENENPETLFSADSDTLIFAGSGGTLDLAIEMNGSKWTVVSNKSWCTVSVNSSQKAYAQITITADANPTGAVRAARLRFIMDSRDTLYVGVGQREFFPDYSDRIQPDLAGMGSTAKAIASQMFAGWNLGNSLESPGSETAWNNPKVTQELIDAVKASGINTVRIPCAWDSHLENVTTCKISEAWLNRVKEVVDYCYNNGMYVILNIHWDGGWLQDNPTYDKQVPVNAKQKALWEQIAVKFRNYDEHLLFAGTNEVHTSFQPSTQNFTVQMSYNQTFVNAVRSTGGKNAYRNLVIQAYNTNIDLAFNNLIMPNDSVNDKLMVEVHYYDPWEFCGLEANASWGTVKNLWGTDYAQYGTISTWGQEDYMLSQFLKMKTKFIDNDYPVILGEYGAIRRSTLTGTELEHHLDTRAYYVQFATQNAKANGLVPVIWDNGFTGNLGFGLFNRSDGSVFDNQALDAMLDGAASGSYPF